MDDKRGPWRLVTPWGERLDFESLEALRVRLLEDPRLMDVDGRLAPSSPSGSASVLKAAEAATVSSASVLKAASVEGSSASALKAASASSANLPKAPKATDSSAETPKPPKPAASEPSARTSVITPVVPKPTSVTTPVAPIAITALDPELIASYTLKVLSAEGGSAASSGSAKDAFAGIPEPDSSEVPFPVPSSAVEFDSPADRESDPDGVATSAPVKGDPNREKTEREAGEERDRDADPEPLSMRDIQVTEERVPRVFARSKTPPLPPSPPIEVETSNDLKRSLMPPPVPLGGAQEEAAARQAAALAEAARAARAAAKDTKSRPPPPATEPSRSQGPWLILGLLLGGALMYVLMRNNGDTPKPPPVSSAEPATTAGPNAPPAAPSALSAPAPPVSPDPSASAAPSSAPVASESPSATGHANMTLLGPAPGPTRAALLPPNATVADALKQANLARAAGDTARSRQLYQVALTRSPDDAEALAGLGDLSRRDGKNTDARAYYEHALIVSPSSIPALLGLADTLWDIDDKNAAHARYAEIVRRVPSGAYPQRVRDRSQ